jgi:xylan 1,4-beta-xylosidase
MRYEITEMTGRMPVEASIYSVRKVETQLVENFRFLLVLEGNVLINTSQGSFRLHEEDLVMLNSYEPYTLYHGEVENKLLSLEVGMEYLSSFFPEVSALWFNVNSVQDSGASMTELKGHLALIMKRLMDSEKGYELLLARDIHGLMYHVYTNFQRKSERTCNLNGKPRQASRMSDIMKYIDGNIHRDVKLHEVAEAAGISTYYLSRIIKENLGMNYVDYKNFLRLEKASRSLISGNRKVTEICYESGFSSINSFNRTFKEYFGVSPSEYRKDRQERRGTERYREAMNGGNLRGKEDAKPLLERFIEKHLMDSRDDSALTKTKTADTQKRVIEADLMQVTEVVKPHWKKLINFGRASEGFRQDLQDQLRCAQKEIGFQYVRFHGIFSDDMKILSRDSFGRLSFNWDKVDRLMDSLMELGLKPFLELGFMPSLLASGSETLYEWKANVTRPEEIDQWKTFIRAFMIHLTERYTLEEVETWYFEIWNQPELEGIYWIGSFNEFLDFFEATYQEIKTVSSRLRVGSPSITHQELRYGTYLEKFLKAAKNRGIHLDFISLHLYQENYSVMDLMKLLEKADIEKAGFASVLDLAKYIKSPYHTEDFVRTNLQVVRVLLRSLNLEHLPVFVTEWNVSMHYGNRFSDTAFKGAFVLDKLVETMGLSDAMGYWTLSDIFEEFGIPDSQFHGGFGMMTKTGLRKPEYYAYQFLSQTGEEVIHKDQQSLITRKGDNVQMILWNHSYFSQEFQQAREYAVTDENLYGIFEDKETQCFQIEIRNITGRYREIQRAVNRESGSSFDEWMRMGRPENMSEEEEEYLKSRSQPQIRVKDHLAEGKISCSCRVPVHGMVFIELKKL